MNRSLPHGIGIGETVIGGAKVGKKVKEGKGAGDMPTVTFKFFEIGKQWILDMVEAKMEDRCRKLNGVSRCRPRGPRRPRWLP